jgi:hypothetical protein
MLSNTNQMTKLFSKINENSEFEIMFNNYQADNKLSMIKFKNLLNFAKHRSSNEKLELTQESILDVSYVQNSTNTYRISINGIERINKILNLTHQRKNNIIFSILVSQFSNSDGFEFINKIRDSKMIYDLDQYDIRIRVSQENNFLLDKNKKLLDNLSNLQYTESHKIGFRYKQRISLIIRNDDSFGKLKLDLTIVKTHDIPSKLHEVEKHYEAELEYTLGSKTKLTENTIESIINEINKEILVIKQVLDNSNEIISKEEHSTIIKAYKKLLYNSELDNSTNLYSMQVISAEVQHIIDKIPNKYCVTEKTDGEKFQLFIYDDTIYLISINLIVQKTKYKIKNLNLTLIEGERFHILEQNKYLFMMYDCIFYNGKDVRFENLLINRLKYIDNFIEAMKIKVYNIKSFISKFDIIEQEKHYLGEIEKFYNNLNKLIKDSPENSFIFHNKICLFPTGADNCEVYSYSYLLLSACINNIKINCPYLIDGIIYTAIDQKYTRDKREQKNPLYKYKPPANNSLDVYITFVRNLENGGYQEIYDNSIHGIGLNKIFRIINFHVGSLIGNKEVPIPFMKEENNHEAYFPLEHNEVRDIEGNIVLDETVVEVTYTNDSSIPHQYRWKILKTRWDKTESVKRDKQKYGNFKDYAIKIWRSIIESVTLDEIKKLSRPDTYNQQQKKLALRINANVISSERAQDIYYQKITNLGIIFRGFHNWIKTILIYSYCGKEKEFKHGIEKKKKVLDFGCGRGGDLMKMYTSRVSEWVATDPAYEDLFGAIDSISMRYQLYNKKFPDFPKVYIIQADSSIPFNSNLQYKKLSNMTPKNKKLIDDIFTESKKFDVINCQFAVHYLFENNSTVDNFKDNVNKFLKIDGYFICTVIDPNQLLKLLNNNNSYTAWYIDNEGQRKTYFKITKFEGDVKDEPGQALDIYMAWINQDDTSKTEYIVTPNFLKKTLEKVGCSLVDTDLFANIYTINKPWMTESTKYESNPGNKKFYSDVGLLYGDLKGADKENKIWSDLFRYYVFKKLK